MDFFDEMSKTIAADAAKRGIRCKPEVWQAFQERITVRPEPEKRCSAPVAEASSVGESAKQLMREAEIPPAVPCVPPPAVEREIPANWDDLRQMALTCRNCHLAAARQNVVFGEGDPHARLMFIGEGPGAEEDASGRPFVGAAGQLLDKMIAAMHLSREEVYIANVVKCRPPGNRVPGEDEAAACLGYLERQIELIKPEVIVLLGGTALHFLLKIDGISRLRGRWQEYKNIAVMPTFHPAFLLRKPEAKREAWHDLKLVMAKLGIPV